MATFVEPHPSTATSARADRSAVDLLQAYFPGISDFLQPDLYQILEHAVDREFNTDTRFLYSEGDPIRHLFLVIDGKVEEMQPKPSNAPDQHVMKRVIGEGTLLGLYDLFYNNAHSTRARRLLAAEVVALRAEAIGRLIYRFPGLRQVLAPLQSIARLRTMPLFTRVNPVALGFIADSCETVQLKADAPIYASGDAAEWIYLIDQGQVRLTWDSEHMDVLLGNGGTFGFVDETEESSEFPKLSHSAAATIPTTGYRIQRETLDNIVDFQLDQRCRNQRQAVEYTVKNLSLFAFSAEEQQKLIGFMSHYTIPNNHIIMQQGEMNDSLWILMPRQRARIHALDKSGQALQSTRVEGINYFGEVALRAQVPVDSTIEAEAHSQWLRLHRRDLEQFATQTGDLDLAEKLALEIDLSRLPRHVTRHNHHVELQTGEFVHTFRQHHWIVLLRKTWPGLLLLLGFLVGIVYAIFASTPVSGWWTLLMLLLGLIATAQLTWGIIDYMNDYLIITNRRVVRQEEVIFLKQWRQEATLEQIQNVDMMASFWGNVLRYGKLVIRTAGAEGAIPFYYVGEPEEVREAIFNLRDRRQAHVMAESKGMIQSMLENRLGLQLQLPALVYRTSPAQLSRRQLPPWMARAAERFYGMRRQRPQSSDYIIWRKHWFILLRNSLPSLGIFLVIFLLLFGQLFAFLEEFRQAFLALDLLLVPLGLLNLGWFIWIVADWRNDTYEIGGEMVVDVEKKPLFFSESRRTARLSEIENVEISIPSPIHYLLNFGNVKLQTAATEGDFTFDWVPDPRAVATEVQRRIEASRNREAEQRTRRRAQELPDWFEMYNRLGGGNGREESTGGV